MYAEVYLSMYLPTQNSPTLPKHTRSANRYSFCPITVLNKSAKFLSASRAFLGNVLTFTFTGGVQRYLVHTSRLYGKDNRMECKFLKICLDVSNYLTGADCKTRTCHCRNRAAVSGHPDHIFIEYSVGIV